METREDEGTEPEESARGDELRFEVYAAGESPASLSTAFVIRFVTRESWLLRPGAGFEGLLEGGRVRYEDWMTYIFAVTKSRVGYYTTILSVFVSFLFLAFCLVGLKTVRGLRWQDLRSS